MNIKGDSRNRCWPTSGKLSLAQRTLGIKIAVSISLVVSLSLAGLSQSFQNLDFEQAMLVPISGGYQGEVQIGPALPGWSVFTQVPYVLYDNMFLDSAGVSILDNHFGYVWSAFQGKFTVVLEGGASLSWPSQRLAVGISQTGTIPASAKTLLFDAWLMSGSESNFVSPGPRYALASYTNYTLYAVDVSQFSGQTVELRFAALPNPPPRLAINIVYLDDIRFSSSPLAAVPLILTPPRSQTVNVGSNVEFTVYATGFPAPTYQWFVNGTNAIAGAISPVLELTDLLFSQSGAYSVVISNAYGIVTSPPAILTVRDPFIISQPLPQSANLGQTVFFSGRVGGTQPLAFQWLKDGVELTDGGRVSGAHTGGLTLRDVSGADGGNYSVTIANANSNVSSIAARLSVTDPNWVTLGSGMNNEVLALAVSGSNLYAGGIFTTAGGVPANFVAKWDGRSWLDLGQRMTGSYPFVSALAVSGTNLYAGGSFDTTGGVMTSNIAKWDGSTWTALGSGVGGGVGGYQTSVSALAVSGTNLYAGGIFITAGGLPANFIAKWDGVNWSALGSGVALGPGRGSPCQVKALVAIKTNLYAGGYFSTAGGVSANNIAKWDGTTWSALGSGLNASVYALAMLGTNLYAAGVFDNAGGVTVSGVAKWDGTVWSALGSELNGTPFSLVVNGTDLYAGGEFMYAGAVPVNNIAKWDGRSWSALGSGLDSWVTALAVDAVGHLFVGGHFSLAGNNVSPYIAQANLGSAAGPAPPTITCPSPLVLECANGAASGVPELGLTDSSGNPVVVVWTIDGTPYQTNTIPSAGAPISTNVTLAAQFGFGEHLLTVSASNGATNPATCSTTVQVRDTTPPQILSLSATPSLLWPPNNRLVPVTIDVQATDNCGPTTSKIVGVTCNEAGGSLMGGPDWIITGDLSLELRAARLGKGQGRVYSIKVECADPAGNSSSAFITVVVPHDHRKSARYWGGNDL